MMSFSGFKVWWCAQWASMFGMARISRPGEGENTSDTVRIQAQAANQPEIGLPLTRGEQYGDIIIPPPESPCTYWLIGAGGLVISGPTPDRPTDGKSGDRGLYVNSGARFHLYGSSASTPGRIRIDSAYQATSPADVVVNGGTHKVSREGDPVGWLVSQYSAIPTTPPAIVCTAVLWLATDPSLPPFPGLPVTVPGTYQQPMYITGGAGHFLG